jgi:hypothetical protein
MDQWPPVCVGNAHYTVKGRSKIMHAISHAAALDHKGRLTEHYSSHQLLEMATEKLPAAIMPEALYVRADGMLLLTLAGDDDPYDPSIPSAAQDIVLVDPENRTVKFDKLTPSSWLGVLLWSRETSWR